VNDAEPFRITNGGIKLVVRLTPRAGHDAIDGVKIGADGAYLQARVRAVPEDGRANRALIALVADAFGVAKTSVTLASGHTSRLKVLHIAGDPSLLAKRASSLAKGK